MTETNGAVKIFDEKGILADLKRISGSQECVPELLMDKFFAQREEFIKWKEKRESPKGLRIDLDTGDYCEHTSELLNSLNLLDVSLGTEIRVWAIDQNKEIKFNLFSFKLDDFKKTKIVFEITDFFAVGLNIRPNSETTADIIISYGSMEWVEEKVLEVVNEKIDHWVRQANISSTLIKEFKRQKTSVSSIEAEKSDDQQIFGQIIKPAGRTTFINTIIKHGNLIVIGAIFLLVQIMIVAWASSQNNNSLTRMEQNSGKIFENKSPQPISSSKAVGTNNLRIIGFFPDNLTSNKNNAKDAKTIDPNIRPSKIHYWVYVSSESELQPIDMPEVTDLMMTIPFQNSPSMLAKEYTKIETSKTDNSNNGE